MNSSTYRFVDYSVRVDSTVRYALADLARVFRCFEDGSYAPPEPTFTIHRRNGKLRLIRRRDGAWRRGVIIEQGRVMPGLEREMNQYVVGLLADRLLMHAAGVTHGRRAVALPATPGGGKSTLAAGLVQRGFGYLTDELLITHPRTNKIIPFPKAMSLKEGSFALFKSLGPEPTGLAYDRVWYLDPERLRPGCIVTKPTCIGWVVFPRYEADVPTRIERLTLGETVLGLFENTVNIARHKEAGLDRLIGIAKKAPGYRLVFGDLEEACKAVFDIVGGDGRSCA